MKRLEERNVATDWLALLLRIREVPDLNLGPDIGYTDTGFCDFPEYLQVNPGIVSQIRP
jgi:hypothetical protein